ncbi:hypothetical protein AVDCRST_MAG81-5106 [uncultured Synechococcales cyanobacterium]|uniref:Uncharacterized protein n=1 Tax=uncultured Synechococcales cyanobacterium TaxID=1936017 RepID=A0A6J4VYH0_9CYAN|nr:hypothetical protein AVDCRST_MAG81-5106 [uncultured Synechococcales cyanobacterium]
MLALQSPLNADEVSCRARTERCPSLAVSLKLVEEMEEIRPLEWFLRSSLNFMKSGH